MNTKFTKKATNDLIVVGGGAAGMLAAGTAAEAGCRVLLIEHSEKLGKKLFITGKGRCNATNNCDPAEVLKNTPHNGRFLYSAVYAFPPEKMMQLLEKWNCPLKTERGNRVFPVSDRASDVIDALKNRLKTAGVRVVYDNVEQIMINNGTVIGVRGRETSYEAPYVLLATGGCSYPSTGSDGSGYRLAEQAGHTIQRPVGSLVPLVEHGNLCAQMQGLALKNVGIRLLDEKKKCLYEDFGELTFTSFGLTGPTVLSASAHRKGNAPCMFEIDLKPALSDEKLDARILRDFGEAPNREIRETLSGLLPRPMVPVMLDICGISEKTPVNSVTREQRRTLLTNLKHFMIQIAGPRPVEEAIVTSGGVTVSEINPKTMESKLQPGLFFAGEIIDVDAYTGGFNLQIAWSTANAAASAISQRIERCS